ncbi:MAG: hypothetical protein Q9219_005608 [cf. Caloplaca sp. 3 TL-2023]
MQRILDSAQHEIEQRLRTGDRPLLPGEIPWSHEDATLRIEAQLTGWSWKMLNNTIDGLRHCLYEEGIFKQVFVNGVFDPEAPPGRRFMYLLPIRGDISGRPNGVNGVEECYSPETRTRLLYQLGDNITASDMHQILHDAKQVLLSKLAKPMSLETPWRIRRNRLILTVSSKGWSWQSLTNGLFALQFCLFGHGISQEVTILDVNDPTALVGPQYLQLKKESSQH